jgi:hypothetical protein
MRQNVLLVNKNGCARIEIYFLCICITSVVLMKVLNAFTHLITFLLYARHQRMHVGLAVLAIQCKVVLFSSWFATEANVANNNND